MKKKLIIATVGLVPVLAMANYFDFTTMLGNAYFVGAQTGYSQISYPNNVSSKTGFPVPLSVDFGQRFQINDRLYLGYETSFGYVGYHAFKVGNTDVSQNLLQANILGTVTGFLNPYVELHGKAGLAFQMNLNSDKSVYAANAVIGAGVGVYVAPKTQLTGDIMHTFGDSGSYPYTHNTIRNTQFLVGIKTYF